MDIPIEGLIFLTYSQFKLLFSSCFHACIQLHDNILKVFWGAE